MLLTHWQIKALANCVLIQELLTDERKSFLDRFSNAWFLIEIVLAVPVKFLLLLQFGE